MTNVAVTLSSYEISATPTLKVSASISPDKLAKDDCIKIKYNNGVNPYVQSKTLYTAAGGTDFYEPFPASETYTVTPSADFSVSRATEAEL